METPVSGAAQEATTLSQQMMHARLPPDLVVPAFSLVGYLSGHPEQLRQLHALVMALDAHEAAAELADKFSAKAAEPGSVVAEIVTNGGW